MGRPNLNEIINQIRNWKIEVSSFRNDGWTRAHYMIMLNKIKKELDSMEPYEIPAGMDAEKDIKV